MSPQKRTHYWVVLLTAISLLSHFPTSSTACTTAVFSGRATDDGRPLLWKNRDTSTTAHNEVVLLEAGKYRALAVVDAGDRKLVWMGVNSAGFCIENSLSSDLVHVTHSDKSTSNLKKLGNGGLMRKALEQCATVADFRKLLLETDQTGRKTHANFGVIDAHGGAAMFEAGPDHFTMFDANSPSDAPEGYIVRSNFATTPKALPANPTADQLDKIYSGQRYLRACSLIDLERQSSADQKLSLEFTLRHLTRDMADDQGEAYPGTINSLDDVLPSIIPTKHTISRTTTVSAAVFHGVRAGEAPELTTMWTMLGDPKFSMAVPCWPTVDCVADDLTDLRGGEIGEIAITLRDWSLTSDRDGIRTRGLPGIWQDIWPREDVLLRETRQAREHWLCEGFTSAEITTFHHSATARAMAAMEQELLEAKQQALTLPATLLATLPAAVPSAIRVAIYDHSANSAPARGPQNLTKFLTPENGFECQLVRPEDVRAGKLSEYQVLVMPGGSGSKQAEMLEPSGCEAIRDFVDGGGGYVGICAGSYLATAQYSWSLNLINARVWDRAHWARGTGTVSLGLSSLGSEFFSSELVASNSTSTQPISDWSQESDTVQRGDAPKVSGSEADVSQLADLISVHYAQGPLLVPGEHPDLPQYEVLATFDSEVAAKGAPVGAMVGTHAIVRGRFGLGRVICYSPHPEAPGGPQGLMSRGIAWAAGND